MNSLLRFTVRALDQGFPYVPSNRSDQNSVQGRGAWFKNAVQQSIECHGNESCGVYVHNTHAYTYTRTHT